MCSEHRQMGLPVRKWRCYLMICRVRAESGFKAFKVNDDFPTVRKFSQAMENKIFSFVWGDTRWGEFEPPWREGRPATYSHLARRKRTRDAACCTNAARGFKRFLAREKWQQKWSGCIDERCTSIPVARPTVISRRRWILQEFFPHQFFSNSRNRMGWKKTEKFLTFLKSGNALLFINFFFQSSKSSDYFETSLLTK